MFRTLERFEGPLSDALLWEIVRDDGPTPSMDMFEELLSERGAKLLSRSNYARLCLAIRGNEALASELEEEVTFLPPGPDRMTREVGLSLLGRPGHLRPEHLTTIPELLPYALSAIRAFRGAHHLDTLVGAIETMADDPFADLVTAFLTLQELVGEDWFEPGDSYPPSWYARVARQWYSEHGVEFQAARTAQ